MSRLDSGSTASNASAEAAFKHLINLKRDLERLSAEGRARHILEITQKTPGYSQEEWKRVELVQAEPGRALFRFKITPADCNYIGMVHGSLLSLLVDNCTTVMLYTLDSK
jgi:acyl-coenzyme A thioesterase PaaI-like protein